MGFTTRDVSYNGGTNTLSGTAVQNQRVTVHVDGAIEPAYFAQSHPVTGAWSVVLTGLATGAHTVRTGLNSTSLRQPLAITKP